MGLSDDKTKVDGEARAALVLQNIRTELGGLAGIDDFELPGHIRRMLARAEATGGRQVPKGYESLAAVLDGAMDQAAGGKGKERHAGTGEPFDRQKICEITRRVGLGYPLGQAIKKATESLRLGDRGPDELKGAINYLAAAHHVMVEMLEQLPGA